MVVKGISQPSGIPRPKGNRKFHPILSLTVCKEVGQEQVPREVEMLCLVKTFSRQGEETWGNSQPREMAGQGESFLSWLQQPQVGLIRRLCVE